MSNTNEDGIRRDGRPAARSSGRNILGAGPLIATMRT